MSDSPAPDVAQAAPDVAQAPPDPRESWRRLAGSFLTLRWVPLTAALLSLPLSARDRACDDRLQLDPAAPP